MNSHCRPEAACFQFPLKAAVAQNIVRTDNVVHQTCIFESLYCKPSFQMTEWYEILVAFSASSISTVIRPPSSEYTRLGISSMYQSHPCAELNMLFRHRPYQGVKPSEATFLFIGLDANYAPDLESSPAFRAVLEYHQDGVAFWRKHGVHHPFLLPDYRGDGRRYHRTFARIGFTPAHAHLVSFAELLHVPTVGRNELSSQDFDLPHLHNLNDAIIYGKAKHIFVSAGVARLMRTSKVFPWLPKEPSSAGPLRVLYSEPDRCVYSHLHFSNYGKFQQQLGDEARAMAALLPASA